MNPPVHLSFQPLHNASALIGHDHTALAHQLHLCRTERSGWRRLGAMVGNVQSFAARHLISILMLVILLANSVFRLIG